MLALLSRYPIIAALPAYIGGVLWRWLHLYRSHDPRAAVYSDMQVYINAARKLAIEGYQLGPLDVTHPPATSWLFAQLYQLDPTFYKLMILQFVVSALIPLALAALAWVAFDQVCAAWAMAISSGYYYHVEYAGFFLSEVYMMLLIPVIMALYLLAVRSKRWSNTVVFGVLAGVCFFVAMSFKTVAGPAIFGFCVVHWLFTTGIKRRVKTIALVTTGLAAIPGMLMVSKRCTEANRGKFCVNSNKSAADFLLGHYDRIESLKWTDSQFGNPSAQQHGYEHVAQVGFSITDSEQNLATAWDWIMTNKVEALVLSVQHIFDLYSVNAPWPVIWTPEWPTAQAVMYLFMMLIIWPACLLLFDMARSSGPVRMFQSIEFALFSVTFGVMLAVFIATGEPRYRLPFDCVFIILGVQFYRRMLARHGWRLSGGFGRRRRLGGLA
jgi:hypothetical protein